MDYLSKQVVQGMFFERSKVCEFHESCRYSQKLKTQKRKFTMGILVLTLRSAEVNFTVIYEI